MAPVKRCSGGRDFAIQWLLSIVSDRGDSPVAIGKKGSNGSSKECIVTE